MTIFKKKATDTQETKKLPMTGKVRKGFRAYCTMVIVGALALGMTTTAFAANDPLTVVNNLSDFIFGLIRAMGMILLGFGIVQVGLSLKSHDPSQRANGFLTLAGGVIITFAKEIPLKLGMKNCRKYGRSSQLHRRTLRAGISGRLSLTSTVQFRLSGLPYLYCFL